METLTETNRLHGAAAALPPTISAREAGTASSGHSRINIPLNLENWKALGADLQADLLWFHQHVLDEGLDWDGAKAAIDYDASTIFRVLKGTYEGSWTNVQKAIRSYRRLWDQRGTIQRQLFVENRITRMIFEALDYALANNSIALVTGESRMGKTVSARAWRDANNHGRSVMVDAPVYGGAKAFLADIASAVGVNKGLNSVQQFTAILRAFNANRMLIVDEAHALLPGDRRTNPVSLEILRRIHDRTGCGVALLATARFEATLKASSYMFEQLLGRISPHLVLPKEVQQRDVEGLVRQYVPRAGQKTLEGSATIANQPGRLGVLVEILRLGSRMANKSGERMNDEHFLKAVKRRLEVAGRFANAEN